MLRLSISINDNPEKLRCLPALDDDFADKVILLRFAGVPMPMPTNTAGEHAAFGAAVRAQLPAFAHWLLNDFAPEPELEQGRFGVATWQHPELAAELHELSPLARFAQLLDEHLAAQLGWENADASAKREPWGWLKALELESQMKDDDRHNGELRRLLSFTGACAQFLGKLRAREIADDFSGDESAQRERGRYRYNRKGKGGAFWMIFPPPRAEG